MPFFKKSLAGPGYLILNAIRVCNIVALLSCLVASFAMLVKTFVVSKFYFFDGVSHLITAVLSILLTMTEMSLFKRYTANNWPLLSPSSGFVTLGILMVVIGVTILGNLNKEATSEDSLGTPAWRIVIASGIVACIFGIINIFVSYCFRNKALGITARQVRAHGKTAEQKVYIPPTTSSSVYNQSPPLSAKPTTRRRSFGLSNPRNINVRRSTTLPSYYTNDKYTAPHQQQSIRNISAPIGSGAAPLVNQNQNDSAAFQGPVGTTPVPGAYPERAVLRQGHPNHEEKKWEGFVPINKEGFVPVINGVQRPDLAGHPAYAAQQF